MICLAKAIQDGNKKPLFHSGRPHPWDEGASWFLQPLQSDEMLIRSHLFFVVFFFCEDCVFCWVLTHLHKECYLQNLHTQLQCQLLCCVLGEAEKELDLS